jgi:hypothetical protein
VNIATVSVCSEQCQRSAPRRDLGVEAVCVSRALHCGTCVSARHRVQSIRYGMRSHVTSIVTLRHGFVGSGYSVLLC